MKQEVAELSTRLAAELAFQEPEPPRPPVTPVAGFYPRGSVDYHQITAINFSSLKFMDLSPKHYQHYLKHPRKQTAMMSLGVSNHTAVLEPERFATHYVTWESTYGEHHGVKPEKVGGSRPRSGKAWQEFKATHAGKTIVTDTEFAEALAFRDAVRRNADVMPLLAVGEPEVAMVWQDQETGLWLKGRVDWKGTILGGGHDFSGRPCITDLKGFSDIHEHMIQRQVTRLCYHGQQAMYADGFEAMTGERPVVTIAAVEMKQPHDAVPYFFSEAELEAGRTLYRAWLQRVAECTKANQWPGLGAGGLRVLRLPSYAYEDDDELELTSGGERLAI